MGWSRRYIVWPITVTRWQGNSVRLHPSFKGSKRSESWEILRFQWPKTFSMAQNDRTWPAHAGSCRLAWCPCKVQVESVRSWAQSLLQAFRSSKTCETKLLDHPVVDNLWQNPARMLGIRLRCWMFGVVFPKMHGRSALVYKKMSLSLGMLGLCFRLFEVAWSLFFIYETREPYINLLRFQPVGFLPITLSFNPTICHVHLLTWWPITRWRCCDGHRLVQNRCVIDRFPKCGRYQVHGCCELRLDLPRVGFGGCRTL